MTAGLRAFAAGLFLCLIATVLFLSAKPPLDSYVEEYGDDCLLKNTCPIVDWAPSSNGFSVVPRQIRLADDGAKIVILSPNNIPIIDLKAYLAAREHQRRAAVAK